MSYEFSYRQRGEPSFSLQKDGAHKEVGGTEDPPASACGEELLPDWSRPGRSRTLAPPPPRRASARGPQRTRGECPIPDGLVRTVAEFLMIHDRGSVQLAATVERHPEAAGVDRAKRVKPLLDVWSQERNGTNDIR